MFQRETEEHAAVEAFCLIAKNTMIVAESSMYYNCLMCCMTQESSVEQLCIPLSEEKIAIVSGCDWSGAKHWVEWWTRESHLRMLSKPFAKMAPGVWNKAQRITNGVYRKNQFLS